MNGPNSIALAIGLALGAGIGAAQQTTPIAWPVAQGQTSAMIGITTMQTARLSLLNPGVPSQGATGAACSAQVTFMDGQGKQVGSGSVNVAPGTSAYVDLPGSAATTTTTTRGEIRALFSIMYPTPATGSSSVPGIFLPFVYCSLMPTLEIFDNMTSKTESVLTDFRYVGYPLPLVGGSGGPLAPRTVIP